MVNVAAADSYTHPGVRQPAGRNSGKYRQTLPARAGQAAAHATSHLFSPCSTASPAINTTLTTAQQTAGKLAVNTTQRRVQGIHLGLGFFVLTTALKSSPPRNCNKKENFPVKCDLWLPILLHRAPDARRDPARSCPVMSSRCKQMLWDTNASADPRCSPY